MNFTRGILRWGLIGAIGLGGLTLLIGSQRVVAGLAAIRHKAQGVVDSCVSDPFALRRQLEDLAGEYPDRIAAVRGELAEVEHQISQFERDIEISAKVVAMTTDDLGQLKTLVAKAEASAATTARPVSIRFEGTRFDIEEAYTEARRISNVRGCYQDRHASDTQQLKFLNEQKARLVEIANKLDTEFSTFQAKMWQLDRQIDAIDRNDRLIDLMKEQQETLASYEKFGKVGNLKQVEGKLAELKAVQEAQLQAMEKRGMHVDYEGRAQYELDSSGEGLDNPFANVPDSSNQPAGDDESPAASGASQQAERSPAPGSVAFADPIVIE